MSQTPALPLFVNVRTMLPFVEAKIRVGGNLIASDRCILLELTDDYGNTVFLSFRGNLGLSHISMARDAAYPNTGKKELYHHVGKQKFDKDDEVGNVIQVSDIKVEVYGDEYKFTMTNPNNWKYDQTISPMST
jgi:hypothetical protein